MKAIILLILGVIAALLIVGGAVGYKMMSEIQDSPASEESAVSKIVDKVSDVSPSDELEKATDIVSEEVKFNEQNGEGYYREVTYKDGGFRQYDTESGELIGSSYDSDQDSLPSME